MLEEFIEANKVNALVKAFKAEVYSVSEACRLTKSMPEDIAKSILFVDDKGDGLLAVVRGDKRVSLEKLRKESGMEGIRLALSAEAVEVSGFPLGGIPPFGIYGVQTILDPSILERESVWCGGGEVNKLMQLTTKELKRVLEETAEGFKIADISQ